LVDHRREAGIMRSSPGSSRRGFTLIEVIVVVGIIGLLLALVIPAVMHARATAAATACRNHLKQIGLALHHHQSAQGRFPAAYAARRPHGNGTFSAGNDPGAFYDLLPYLDQKPLYDAINLANSPFPISMTREENSTARAALLDVLLCPADSWPNRMDGPVSYRLNCANPFFRAGHSVDPNTYDRPVPGDPLSFDGAFGILEGIAATEIRDGLSTTAGVSERVLGSGGGFEKRRDLCCTGTIALQLPSRADDLRALCGSLRSEPPFLHAKLGHAWYGPMYLNTWYNHVMKPNDVYADCTAEAFLGEDDWISRNGTAVAARSAHGGGVNLMMMDGSVRFLRDSIDLGVWRALGSRSGGEPAHPLD
jgi:prepilin-type N-terminal cleavage/methylation domain-containing protein/prepilin-type processing-associated H-X9-DG protein